GGRVSEGVLRLRRRCLADLRSQLELLEDRWLRPRIAPGALAEERPGRPSRRVHRRVLALAALQLRTIRRRPENGGRLAGPVRPRRGVGDQRPRPQLPAVRAADAGWAGRPDG